MLASLIALLFPACLLIAAVTDLRDMKIPNWISLLLIAGFLALALLVSLSLADFGWHLAAGAVVFAVCFALFAANIMGGGDVKLLAAAALWFGFDASLLTFLIYTSYAGGIFTIILILLRRQSHRVLALGLPIPDSILHAKKVPYGVAICIGGVLAMTSSPLMTGISWVPR